MALGDVTMFEAAMPKVQNGTINLETGTFKLALITDAVTPTAGAADPRFGAGGSTNYLTNQVTPGGNYITGGATIGNPNVTLSSGVTVFDGDNVEWLQNAGNPTNARWGIIYQDDANDHALGFVDLGSNFDMTTGPLNVNWSANGILRTTVNV